MLTNKLIIIAISVWLGACGYHLRGAVDLPEGLKSAYLEGASVPLREQFRVALRAASGQLTNTPDGAGVVIRIFAEQASQRVLSLSARGRSNELELYYRVEYELLGTDQTLLAARQPLEIKREYFNNQEDIIAKANEETVIRGEMYQQAVRAIIDRARIVLAANPK
ncbi:MAG: LPS assembly lipoprotein LptE [Methylovulum sp.]|nr:LPS assembly lipoprotein LptE [Methylovulum sp.]